MATAPPPIPPSTPVRNAPPAPPAGRRLLEILLDPRSIQWLLMSGAVLLVVGLAIYLWAIGIFENATTVAVALGLGTGTMLVAGWAIIKYTRYQTAGRALTLLACLVMPLNLWFYHANNLITLQGQLWAPALVCCLAYAASALVLRDELFVYVFSAGLAMTGLLILADENVQRFWEVAAPASMLVIMGLLAIHAERAFPDHEGPFTRRRFGRAFFWSGHALLGAGLLFLLSAQIAGGWLYTPVFEPIYQKWGFVQPVMVTDFPWKLVSLVLVLAGTYAYLYSDIVVRRVGVYVHIAIFTLLWAEILIVNLVDLAISPMELAIAAMAVTGLAANVLQMFMNRQAGEFVRSGPPLGLLLSTVPVLLGMVMHLQATNLTVHHRWPYDPTWGYVGAMLATALSCRLGAYLYRHTMPRLSAIYFFGTAGATLVGAAALLMKLGVEAWTIQSALLMIIPLAYLVASRLYRGHTAEQPLLLAGYTATVVMFAAAFANALEITPQVLSAGDYKHEIVGIFFAEVALFFGLATAWRRKGLDVYLAAAAACAAVWQLLLPWAIHHPEFYALAFALLGFGLLLAYRLRILERFEQPALTEAAFQSANALLSLAFLAAALLSLGRVTSHAVEQSLIVLLVSLTALSLASAWLVQHQAWRRWYVIMGITEALLTFATINLLSTLTLWQKAEIFSVVVGSGLLLIGHWGWYREQERQSDMVSLCLILGSLMAGVPFAIAVPHYRYNFDPNEVHWAALAINEAGLLILSLFLLASGVMFRLKSTTLVGGSLLGVYVISLILFIRLPAQIKTAALWLAIGGGTIFLIGLFLSIYRDRLLALPDKIKRREGVFRVLGWR